MKIREVDRIDRWIADHASLVQVLCCVLAMSPWPFVLLSLKWLLVAPSFLIPAVFFMRWTLNPPEGEDADKN